jgi:hypothetical protein
MTTTRAHEPSMARKPPWKRQQFWRAVLPALALVCAAIAGLLVYNAFVGSSGVKEKSFGTTYPEPPTPKTVKFTDAERAVAKKFVVTAVARKHLDQAYAISGPGVRQGMTLKQFMQGTIPVVPYLVKDTTVARIAIEQSYATSAQIQVYIETPHQRGRIFFMDLVKAKNGKWLVNAWSPRGSPRIPSKVG